MSSLNEDSPPFAALQGSAEEFKTAFDADIDQCLTALNSKITALMCDPSSLGSSGEARPGRGNAHVEFSMAKYGILAGMKSLYEEKERSWLERLEDMKGEFIENVEVFLANTKLEVKLPDVAVTPHRVGMKKTASSPNVAKQESQPSTIASIYPKLFNTAKHIPVLSSMLPTKSVEEEESSEEEEQPQVASVITPKPTGRTPKRVTISEPDTSSPGQNGASRRRLQGIQTPSNVVSTQVMNYIEESESEEEEEEPVVVQTPVKRMGRGRKSAANTPASLKKETVITPLRRRNAPEKESDSSNEERAAPVIETTRRGRKSAMPQPAVETVANSTPGKRGRPKKKTNGKEVQYQPDEDVMETDDDISTASGSKTPKQVHFALGLDPNEDLEIYSPEYSMSRSVPRRKTMVTHAVADFEDICLTPEVTRGKSKRKTFAGSHLDQSVAPSPKRLKRAVGRSSLAVSEMGLDETNLLESEGASESRYSPWIPLSSVSGSVPVQPGVYELKVSAAKKPAFIGACDSLRHSLTLHRLKHNSGHKQLDKFVERNAQNVLVRYEPMPTAQEAKMEEKSRIKDFVDCYKTTPAYN